MALKTVRVRVTAAATLAVAVVVVVAGALIVMRQRAALIEQLDENVSAHAQRVAAEIDANGIRALSSDIDDDLAIFVVDADRRVVTKSTDAELPSPLPRADRDDDEASNVTIDGEEHRLAAHAYAAPDGREGFVYVGADREDVDESVADLVASLLLIIPAATALLVIVVWVVVGRTLRPVERMRSEVASIDLAQLDRRVRVPPGTDEIARLARTMNEMLGRLERSAQRQRQFVSDASHELRSPLTRMRTELEVDERDPQADPVRTRQSLLDEIAGLQRLIDDLLTLARGDAGAHVHSERVDLDDLVFEEVRSERSPSIELDASRVSAAQVTANRDELRRVVRNLIDNARRHARRTVTIELHENDGWATLVVGDDGPGIPADRRADVFERFTRLDESRTGAGRAGLGLAIVRDIVTRHGGTVEIGESSAGGAGVEVRLPCR